MLYKRTRDNWDVYRNEDNAGLWAEPVLDLLMEVCRRGGGQGGAGMPLVAGQYF
jgi:hypothetical protein